MVQLSQGRFCWCLLICNIVYVDGKSQSRIHMNASLQVFLPFCCRKIKVLPDECRSDLHERKTPNTCLEPAGWHRWAAYIIMWQFKLRLNTKTTKPLFLLKTFLKESNFTKENIRYVPSGCLFCINESNMGQLWTIKNFNWATSAGNVIKTKHQRVNTWYLAVRHTHFIKQALRACDQTPGLEWATMHLGSSQRSSGKYGRYAGCCCFHHQATQSDVYYEHTHSTRDICSTPTAEDQVFLSYT